MRRNHVKEFVPIIIVVVIAVLGLIMGTYLSGHQIMFPHAMECSGGSNCSGGGLPQTPPKAAPPAATKAPTPGRGGGGGSGH